MRKPSELNARNRSTKKLFPVAASALLALACAPAAGPAQQPPPAPPAQAAAPPRGPVVGSIAPDFSLPAATRYGRTAQPFRLSQYRGQTIVLAFFSRARTRG